jgi:hypothetical protein
VTIFRILKDLSGPSPSSVSFWQSFELLTKIWKEQAKNFADIIDYNAKRFSESLDQTPAGVNGASSSAEPG